MSNSADSKKDTAGNSGRRGAIRRQFIGALAFFILTLIAVGALFDSAPPPSLADVQIEIPPRPAESADEFSAPIKAEPEPPIAVESDSESEAESVVVVEEVAPAAAAEESAEELNSESSAEFIPLKESAPDDFVVQAIAVSEKEKAEKIAADLRAQGLPSFVEPRTHDGGKIIYRVRIGGYANRADAELDRQKAVAAGMKSAIVLDLR